MPYDDSVRDTKIALEARDLGKRFGELWALRHLDLNVPTGRVLGLLGHNGAGKTTAIRILTTLAQPTEGTAAVAGHDVVTAGAAVRSAIGVAAQAATVDGLLTARANLEMVGRLYHLSRAEARQRASELLEQVDLVEFGDKLVKEFSGGMRRRLDLAASFVAKPRVLFLDEPTTGLDPRSRNELWELLRERVRQGTTVVLTTQYLDEADQLADDIVVLDHGEVAARGTPAELKQRIGGDRIVVSVGDPSLVAHACGVLAPFSEQDPVVESGETVNPQGITISDGPIRVVIRAKPSLRLVEVVRALDQNGIDALDIARRETTLDDVFLAITSAKRGRYQIGQSTARNSPESLDRLGTVAK
ncbi:MAG TPA: ATP-binding cassette domain-containing protein [Kofleriaceae bacterium]